MGGEQGYAMPVLQLGEHSHGLSGKASVFRLMERNASRNPFVLMDSNKVIHKKGTSIRGDRINLPSRKVFMNFSCKRCAC